MNTIIIAGHLGSDPETRFTPGGQKVTNFRLAVNTRSGGQDITIWYRVAVWGDRFDNMMPHLKKGSALIVTGELKAPQTYVDREGNTQVSLEVSAEMLKFPNFGRKNEQGEQGGSSTYQNRAAPQPAEQTAFQYGGSSQQEDDLPF